MTPADELAALHEAVLDLAYDIFKALGIIALCEKLGLTLKPWVRERQTRDLHRSITPDMQAKIDRANADIARSEHGHLTIGEAAERLRQARPRHRMSDDTRRLAAALLTLLDSPYSHQIALDPDEWPEIEEAEKIARAIVEQQDSTSSD